MASFKNRNSKKVRNILIAVLVFLTGFIIFIFNPLRVDQILVESVTLSCTTDTSIRDELLKDIQNILFFNREEINQKITGKFSCIKHVSLQWEFPRNITVAVEKRVPVANISRLERQPLDLLELEASPSSSTAFLDWSFTSVNDLSARFQVDESGLIFQGEQGLNIPLLFIVEPNLSLGQKLDKDIFGKLAVIFKKFPEIGPIDKAKLVGNNLLIQSQHKFIFSLEQDVFKQLASLQLILEKAKIDDRTMELIDLRFDKPVIIYSSLKKNER